MEGRNFVMEPRYAGGKSELMPELTPQRLKLLKQIVPTLSRVAILWQPATLSEDAFKQMLNQTQATARSIGVVGSTQMSGLDIIALDSPKPARK